MVEENEKTEQPAESQQILNASEQIKAQANALSSIITLEPETAKELTHIESELWVIAQKMDNNPDDVISALISENARVTSELKKTKEILERLNGEHDSEIRRDEREKTRRETIYELLKSFGYNCVGQQETCICNVCNAARYCAEIRDKKKFRDSKQE